MIKPSPYLSIALEAVTAAETIIRQYYQEEVRVQLKPDQSPVTVADQEAEHVIRQVIKNAFPKHSILGEETGETGQNSEYLWIIDPIDGTKNYTRRVPLFATQLALMKNGEVIVAVSNAPALNELVYAEKNQGCYLNDGQPLHVSTVDQVKHAYLSYGGIGYFSKHELMQQLLQLEKNTMAHRGIGDFWSYHLLAQGKIDIMLEAETKIWDIAALSLIVVEAGGKVTDFQGQPVSKQTTSIVATNGQIHEEVLQYFS